MDLIGKRLIVWLGLALEILGGELRRRHHLGESVGVIECGQGQAGRSPLCADFRAHLRVLSACENPASRPAPRVVRASLLPRFHRAPSA